MNVIKRFLKFAFYILIKICVVIMRLSIELFGFVSLSEFLSIIPSYFGRALRYEYYRRTLESCGQNVKFSFGVHLSYPNICIGDNVRLGHFNALGLVDIGDNVLFAAFCFVPSGGKQHSFERLDIPINQQPGELSRIHIGNDCWIGAHSVIMADLGDGCVVGAGSIVTKPVPPYSVVAGNPAEVIRSRKDN